MCEQLVNPHKIIRSWIQLRSSSVYKFSFQVKDLTYPVDVILTVVGVVIVDDKLDIIHINTSGRNICGPQDGSAAGLELTQDPVPLFLLLVTVNAHGWPAILPHQPGKQHNCKKRRLIKYHHKIFCNLIQLEKYNHLKSWD